MTKILVLTEKHCTRYFDVTTDEQLHKVALFILKSRFDEGYWYLEPEAPEPLDFKKEDIAKMPQSMQAAATEQWKRYARQLDHYEEAKGDWNDIQTAIANNDGKLAWRVLRDRSGYEYEGVEIEKCEEPE